jgi:hypothetical protein
MDFISALIDQLFDNVGDLWFAALVGQFFVMICESAKPKPAEGERTSQWEGLGLWVSILSLLTPVLLLVHAVATGSGAVIAALAIVVVAAIGAALIGWVIAATAPGIGRTLNRAAPFLAVAVFALTIYITWRSVFALVNMVVAGSAA